MNTFEMQMNCLVLACFVGLPTGALVFGMLRVVWCVFTGSYTNDNPWIS